MHIQVTCPQGHKLKAPSTYAGKQAKCPTCGGIVTIPLSGQTGPTPSAASPTNTLEMPERKASGKRYYNKEWNFSIAYPMDWELLWENRPQGSWVMAVAVAGKPGGRVRPGLIVNVRRGEVLEGSSNVTVIHIGGQGTAAQAPKTPGEYIERSKEDLRQAFSGLRFLSGEEIRLINKPATRVVYSYDIRSGRMQEMCVTIFGVGITFQITCEVAPVQFDVFKPAFDQIIGSFNIGSEPYAHDDGVAAAQPSDSATPVQIYRYNRAVAMYHKGQFKGALDAFGEVFQSGELRMQAVYARALCQKELGLPVEIPSELGGHAEDAGTVYVATNLACYLIGKGHEAALTKEGSSSEITALIDGSRYVVSVSSLFGGFNNWVWRKDGDTSTSIADPSANPNPTKTDKLVISLVEYASSLPMSPLPEAGLKTTLNCPSIGKITPDQGHTGDIGEGKKLCLIAAQLRQQWQQEENLAKAEALFREAVQKFPNLWMAHFGLGELLILKAARSGAKSGRLLDEGVAAVTRAVESAPAQPEPLLKLAATLAETSTDAAERYYRQALGTLDSQTESLYPLSWQAIDHWNFAIEAAERDRHSIAVDAFCRAISMNKDYEGTYMPSPAKANVAWQSALKKLGKTRWFEQRQEHDRMLQSILGMIAEESYPWFLGGVLLGGAVIVPVGIAMLMDGVSPAVAWIGGIASAIVFLLCLDKRGNFRWVTAVPAIAVAVIGANVYHQSTGRPVAVVGGVLGFAIYAIFGAIGVGIGKLVRGKS